MSWKGNLMTDFNDLINQAQSLIEETSPELIQLRSTLLDIEDLINAPEYNDLSDVDRLRLQTARKDLKSRLDSQAVISDSTQLSDVSSPSLDRAPLEKSPSSTRRTDGEEQMEEAEKLFYSGRYAEAIKLFDRVLDLVPEWERARQHRAEAEDYLRSGYIPAVALPAEAASAFGKAQSASRVGRYSDAMALLSKAQSVMREMGIQRWQEGLEFEQKLQESIDAENAYHEGLKFFETARTEGGFRTVQRDEGRVKTGKPD